MSLTAYLELTTLALYIITRVKIAVNTRLLLADRMEGIARFIHETTRRMVLAHPEVEFHFLFDRPYDPKFIYADNVHAHVLGPPSRHPVLWYIWFEHSVRRFLKKNKTNVFFSGDMYMSLKSDVPCLYVSHDLNYIHYPEGLKYSHLLFLQRFFPQYHKAADRIITVSNFTKQDIIKQYGIPDSKIDVAYNSVPEGFKAMTESQRQEVRNKYSSGEKFFIYVGSLHPRKNLEGLLSAFEIFKAKNTSDIKLLIFGRAAFKTGPIFRLYEKLKCKEDIIFLGDNSVRVQDILPAAEALCYPSLFEGFGIPILEAFHSEVAVISSNVSSMPEVAGDAALLIDPEDPESIAGAMKDVLDPSLKTELISRGILRREKFSWDSSAEIIYERLLEIAGSK